MWCKIQETRFCFLVLWFPLGPFHLLIALPWLRKPWGGPWSSVLHRASHPLWIIVFPHKDISLSLEAYQWTQMLKTSLNSSIKNHSQHQRLVNENLQAATVSSWTSRVSPLVISPWISHYVCVWKIMNYFDISWLFSKDFINLLFSFLKNYLMLWFKKTVPFGWGGGMWRGKCRQL